MVVSVNANLGMEGPVAVNVRMATGVNRWQTASVSQKLLSKSNGGGRTENNSGPITFAPLFGCENFFLRRVFGALIFIYGTV